MPMHCEYCPECGGETRPIKHEKPVCPECEPNPIHEKPVCPECEPNPIKHKKAYCPVCDIVLTIEKSNAKCRKCHCSPGYRQTYKIHGKSKAHYYLSYIVGTYINTSSDLNAIYEYSTRRDCFDVIENTFVYICNCDSCHSDGCSFYNEMYEQTIAKIRQKKNEPIMLMFLLRKLKMIEPGIVDIIKSFFFTSYEHMLRFYDLRFYYGSQVWAEMWRWDQSFNFIKEISILYHNTEIKTIIDTVYYSIKCFGIDYSKHISLSGEISVDAINFDKIIKSLILFITIKTSDELRDKMKEYENYKGDTFEPPPEEIRRRTDVIKECVEKIATTVEITNIFLNYV
jgi:hypothetical protein